MTTKQQLFLLQPDYDWIYLGGNKSVFKSWNKNIDTAEFEHHILDINELVYLRENLPLKCFSIKSLRGWHDSNLYRSTGEIFLDEHGETIAQLVAQWKMVFYGPNMWQNMYIESGEGQTESEIGSWRVYGTFTTKSFTDKEEAREYAMQKIKERNY